MGRATNYSAQLLSQGFRARAVNTITQWPATLYVALLSANPPFNDMVSAAEAPYTGYTAGTSRAAIANSTGGWNAASTTTGANAVTMTNAAALNSFPNATGSGTITGVALCNDNSTAIATQITFTSGVPSTGGTVYWVSITSQAVVSGNAITIAASSFTTSED